MGYIFYYEEKVLLTDWVSCANIKKETGSLLSLLGDTGIEPVTPSVSCLYSNQLS